MSSRWDFCCGLIDYFYHNIVPVCRQTGLAELFKDQSFIFSMKSFLDFNYKRFYKKDKATIMNFILNERIICNSIIEITF